MKKTQAESEPNLPQVPFKPEEIEIDRWMEGLSKVSYDKRQHKSEEVGPPSNEMIGTVNERFIVTMQEILEGRRLMRKCAELAKIPVKYPTSGCMSEVIFKTQVLYALVMSLFGSVKYLCYYEEDKLKDSSLRINELLDKVDKLARFVNTTREIADNLQKELGDISVTPQELKLDDYRTTRPPARINDRPARPAKSRKDTTSKSFSLTSLLDNN